jgi:hypothetical protein
MSIKPFSVSKIKKLVPKEHRLIDSLRVGIQSDGLPDGDIGRHVTAIARNAQFSKLGIRDPTALSFLRN